MAEVYFEEKYTKKEMYRNYVLGAVMAIVGAILLFLFIFLTYSWDFAVLFTMAFLLLILVIAAAAFVLQKERINAKVTNEGIEFFSLYLVKIGNVSLKWQEIREIAEMTGVDAPGSIPRPAGTMSDTFMFLQSFAPKAEFAIKTESSAYDLTIQTKNKVAFLEAIKAAGAGAKISKKPTSFFELLDYNKIPRPKINS